MTQQEQLLRLPPRDLAAPTIFPGFVRVQLLAQAIENSPGGHALGVGASAGWLVLLGVWCAAAWWWCQHLAPLLSVFGVAPQSAMALLFGLCAGLCDGALGLSCCTRSARVKVVCVALFCGSLMLRGGAAAMFAWQQVPDHAASSWTAIIKAGALSMVTQLLLAEVLFVFGLLLLASLALVRAAVLATFRALR